MVTTWRRNSGNCCSDVKCLCPQRDSEEELYALSNSSRIGSHFSFSLGFPLVFPLFILILDDQEDLKTPDPSCYPAMSPEVTAGAEAKWKAWAGQGIGRGEVLPPSPAPRCGTSGPTTCSTAMAGGKQNSRA